MSRLILVICPSNQDQNPVVVGGNEMTHIAPLAMAILAEAQRCSSIIARVFTATPESRDWPRGSYAGLIDQQKAAAAWIATTRQPGDLTVSLNLHSDSGKERHCGYYYDPLSGPVSEWLGRAVCDVIKTFFGGKIYSADYSAYIFARETRFVACPLLLECGAHTMAADVSVVRDHAGEVAEAMVNTLIGFFGLETKPPLNCSELRTYGEWSLARLFNAEDPRNLEAFKSHLAAIGADSSSSLSRYGVPVS